MICFLTTLKFNHTITRCLATEGRELRGRIVPKCYGSILLARELPVCSYIFSDLERLQPSDLKRLESIHRMLVGDRRTTVLNHPTNTLRRFDLLEKLHQSGVNSFRAYRLSDNPRPERFPVFVRGEDDHKGSLSTLIHSQQELDRQCHRWTSRFGNSARILVIEYLDGQDEDGIFRKYSAFKIGNQIIPRHLFFDTQWCVKAWNRLDEALLQEELRYVNENPHTDQLAKVFEIAGIDFGRVDYGVINGKIEVWEINTNPILPVNFGDGGPSRLEVTSIFTRRFVTAMKQIDSSLYPNEKIVLPRRAIPLWAAPSVPAKVLYRRVTRGSRKKIGQAA